MLNERASIVLDDIKSRRSIRKFQLDKEVEQEKLDTIFEAARWSPTNCNKQLWKLIVIDKDEIKQKLVKEAGSSTLILRAPIVIVVLHYDDVYLEAFQTSSIVTQNIMLMANELGLGTLFLNSKGNAKKIKEILNIPEKYIVTNFILLGYYDTNKKRTPPKRKDIKEFVSFNSFEGIDELQWSHDPSKWNYNALKEYQTYISRKTEIGTMQDVFDEDEASLVKTVSKEYKENHLDLFSYDGWILNSFADTIKDIRIAETSQETIIYTKATLKRDIKAFTFEELEKSSEKFDTISLNFRLERLPDDTKKRVFEFVKTHLNDGGVFYIISRNNSFLFSLFYNLLIKKLGDNISKTAIFSFFGPYKPISHTQTIQELKSYGFEVEDRRYYPFPPLFRTIARLMHQYKLSGGGNFMHRIDKETTISKIFGKINELEKKLDLKIFGSISYIKCKKQ